MAKTPAIDVRDITVEYQGQVALREATATVPMGAICGLVGMNGAGKSTLFKSIMNATPKKSGSVRLHGHTVKTAQKQGIVAYVPQTEAVDWEFPVSVWDVVMMGRYGFMSPLRRITENDKKHVSDALARVHLTDYADRQVGQLSGGQRKRVFVARALAQGATILLLDEPFAGVDANTERSLIELLRELQKEDITTLIAAHDLATIASYCDHMILLNQTVVAAGPTKNVFTRDNVAKTYDNLINLERLPWIS